METSTAHVPARIALAQAYARVAKAELHSLEHASRSVSAGNAVLAAIAASDVLCIIHLGRRSASTNHSDAVEPLREFDPEAARDLLVLTRDKVHAHYGVSPIDRDTLTRMIRSMDRLIARATEAVAGLKRE